MRALVVLAVVGVCSAVPFVQDTPEVAAEKARFFQAYQAAQASAQPQYNAIPHQAYSTGHYNPSHHNPGHYNHAQAQPKWTGPLAATVPAGVDGTITPVSDTRDVAAARNAFFNTYQAQVAATVGAAPRHHGGAVHYQAAPTYTNAAPVQPRWTGPVAATIPAGLPGAGSQVADTPEVAAAKQAFHSTFQRQAAAAAPPTRYY